MSNITTKVKDLLKIANGVYLVGVQAPCLSRKLYIENGYHKQEFASDSIQHTKMHNKSNTAHIRNTIIRNPVSHFSTSTNKQPKRHQQLHEDSKERSVPSSQFSRLFYWGGLAANIGASVLGDSVKRSLGSKDEPSSVMNEANAKKLVDTLSRMRGAALKLGQMLSLQDEGVLPPELAKIFDRVRYSADFMPAKQLESVMKNELGDKWRSKFKEFEMRPIAAASIGQVHRGVLKDGREVAVKVQYPGVAESIDSDFNNLISVLNWTGMVPKGLYLDKSVASAKKELLQETDYENEAKNQLRFKSLLADDKDFMVPDVIKELSTKRVLTTEMIDGEPIDTVVDEDQETRNFVASRMLKLCLRELFEFKFMQTDPNWSNFFFNKEQNKIGLLDFGNCREFPAQFIDEYLRVVHAASIKDRKTIVDASIKMGFLTGDETKVMIDAHTDAVMIVGEPFVHDEPYNFQKQKMTSKIHELIPTMIKYRLTSPPEETYSLHRKLAGSFLLCNKFGAVIPARSLFMDVYNKYHNKK